MNEIVNIIDSLFILAGVLVGILLLIYGAWRLLIADMFNDDLNDNKELD